MARSQFVKVNENIAAHVVGGYKKVEDGVVASYKKIEDTAVNGFNRMADHFVGRYLTKEGESVKEARTRLEKR